MAPQLIFGTGTFGLEGTEFQTQESTESILRTLKELGINHLDTAARYPAFVNRGRAEELIGLAKGAHDGLVIDTKVYTSWVDGSGELRQEVVRQSVSDSLERLRQPQGVNVLYAHQPDPTTPLEEQILALNEQIELGHCKEWGICNTQPEVLENILKICEEKCLRKPTAYQGQYSILGRGMEAKLLPIVRAHGMRFHAYAVLNAGFLTGNLTNNTHQGTRLDEKKPLGKAMQSFFPPELHQVFRKFEAQVKAHGLTPLEVAVRWAVHHSALGDGDAVLLGASRTPQIVQTVGLIRKGPLAEELVRIADGVWEEVKGF